MAPKHGDLMVVINREQKDELAPVDEATPKTRSVQTLFLSFGIP